MSYFMYGEKFNDGKYEYRNVVVPNSKGEYLHQIGLVYNRQHKKLLSENEWRSLGISQAEGWEHYAHYQPEPLVLMFRKRID